LFLLEFLLLPALIQPVGSPEIAGIGAAVRPAVADALFMAVEFLERSQEGPGARLVAICLEPDDAARGPVDRVEAEDCLDT
jgi:hypothetical protein